MPNTRLGSEELTKILEELLELIRSNKRDIPNICPSGGLWQIMSLIFSHPDTNVRKLACYVMTDATKNNVVVQTYALKYGALNLTRIVDSERDLELKEAFFGSLSSFLKGENEEGKRLFIKEYDGSAVLHRLLFENLTRPFLRQVL